MRKLGITKRVGAVLLGLLAVWAMTAASAIVISPVYAQSTWSEPRTWHVLIGGQSKDHAIQAEGYYPRVITIDAGDTVVWTLNTGEIHSVTFAGTCEDSSVFLRASLPSTSISAPADQPPTMGSAP